MANVLFANNASSLLAASISAVDTVIQVASGTNFPSPTGGDYAVITLVNDVGDIEVVHCTSRTGNLLTVERAKEGTTAQAFTLTLTRVELRLTKGTMDAVLQLAGGSMTGNLNMVSNEVQNANITGTTVFTGGQTVGTSIRGDLGVSTNEIVVPSGGGRATAGGVPILVNTDDVIALMDTGGVITLSSGTIGTVVPAGAYLRVQDAGNTDWLQMSHDGTDFAFAFTNTGDVNWSGGVLAMASDIQMTDNTIHRAHLSDVSMSYQTVAGASTVALDYEAGQYVNITMGANIVTFSVDVATVPATTRFAAMRLQFTQDGVGGRTMTWPVSFKFPAGAPPVLSTGAGAIDVVDIWTTDHGTTWYGAYAQGFS